MAEESEDWAQNAFKEVTKHVHGDHVANCPLKQHLVNCSTCLIDVSKLDRWDEQSRGMALKARFGERSGRALLEFLNWRKPLKRPMDDAGNFPCLLVTCSLIHPSFFQLHTSILTLLVNSSIWCFVNIMFLSPTSCRACCGTCCRTQTEQRHCNSPGKAHEDADCKNHGQGWI